MKKDFKVQVLTLENKKLEDVILSKDVFGVEIKKDIVARVVNWQMAKKRQGSHKVKERNEIKGTNAKMYRQKGTGRARHGSKKVVQFKGGGVVHGPRVRSYEYKIPSKIKKHAMKIALSSKLEEGKIKIIDSLTAKKIKTKEIEKKLNILGVQSATFLEDQTPDKNFSLSVRNLKEIDLIPIQGINVLQVLKRDLLIISKNALKKVEKRFI